MKVTRLATDRLRVPFPKTTRVSLTSPAPTTPDAVELILVHLETDSGITGLGFTYVLGAGGSALRALIDTELSPIVLGEDPRDTDRLFARAEGRFRGVGFAGLAARAYSAVDIALWDARAKAAGAPLAKMLGGAKSSAAFVVSDAATLGRDAAEVLKIAKPHLKQGAVGVRIEIGAGDVQADADRVREIQEGVGEDGWIAVTADSRFDLSTALALTHFFEDVGVDVFEDPIPAADTIGYDKLARLAEVPLAIGASFDSCDAFLQVIRNGTIRTIRPDVCRLGGITPLLKVAAVAEAYHIAVSPVRLPEVGVHLACGLASVPHVDSVSWFKDVFTGGAKFEGGKMTPTAEPGLGLTMNEEVAAKWRIS
ncbi:mandelate racemase/muconate lactonizing enzyme family protein [Gemmata sp. G18]|uniref:Mandelate racemase/muconate lactonizing enzyme family protein n=1 Tax=Gemmata palustris TaxID=2822762 RepID=A0ABS5BV43_9BACT|nr:mandelate racemase/muconate lactonizing enzyme family protein [Gemmata palustris]MBP3957607.1 mandelate racemase/muconate lactonizing enzyme family protein [Gemmata palustris]